jgi:hypothetical protein
VPTSHRCHVLRGPCPWPPMHTLERSPIPAHALPWPRNLLFHPFVGIHTSIFMSESAVGLSTAITRQNAGSCL